jgi:acid phosphatase
MAFIALGFITVLVSLALMPRAGFARLFQVDRRPASAAAHVPNFQHVFIIMMENKAAGEVLDSSAMPYLNQLAARYGIAANYYGIRHPSLPNYIALTGGDTFGITKNCTDCMLNQANIADQIEAAGRSWKAYIEDLPHACFLGDAEPLYRQKHNPFIYYDTIRTNPARCAQVVPFTEFGRDLAANALPDYVWITPNMCHSTHDCSLQVGDEWLHTWVDQIIASPAWRNNGVLFITYDEGNTNDKSGCCTYAEGGHIVTLVISPLVKPGYRSPYSYSHYSLLRTIEAAWGLPLLGRADCDCSPTMADFFTP